MRILALSDIADERVYSERVVETFSDIDLVVGCGDLPYDYLEYVVTVLNRPLLYVHGNHDAKVLLRADGRQATGAEGCELIDGRVVRELGCSFLGLGGSIRYRPGAPFQFTQAEMRIRVVRLLPRLLWNRVRHGRFIDVMVTHSPPFGIHDGDDRAHVGFKAFITLMKLFKPQLVLHGHVHGNHPQRTVSGDTQVMGVFPVRRIELPSCGELRA